MSVTDVFAVRPTELSVRRVTWQSLWWLPLAVILAVQAVLSVRLIPHVTAGPDEARYIWAGHQLIYQFWHGGGSPYFETYFSGAPVIYSPIAALADHAGGLVAVRLLCLSFMLTATVLLFLSSRRLFGYWPGVLSAAAFASVGLTHDIGVYGNYDSMALMLVAAATYSAVRSYETRWLLAVPVLLLLANATKYMTLVFDPVVVAVASLQAVHLRTCLRRFVAVGGTLLALLSLALYLAGTAYLQGILYTTVARQPNNAAFSGHAISQAGILRESWRWIGVLLLLSLVAVVFAAASHDGRLLLTLVLLAGAVAVTVEALHIHSDESMHQHDTFSAWFAALAVGYVAVRLRRWHVLAIAPLCVALAWSVYLGIGVDRRNYEGGHLVAASYARLVQPYVQGTGIQRYLIGYVSFGLVYDLHVNVPWWRLSDDLYLKYPIPGRGGDTHGQTRGPVCKHLAPHCMYLEGPAAYVAAIHAHYFTLISMYASRLNVADDKAIVQAAEHTPGYVVLTSLGKTPTWIYAPAYAHR